ncbi:MAG: TlpA disulfide reductase family protein [Sediminibacterium sp.]
MKKRFLLLVCFISFISVILSQEKVTRITYKGVLNLNLQKESLGSMADQASGSHPFYIDLYYTQEKVRTKMRNESKIGFAASISDLIYEQGIPTMYKLDENRAVAFETNTPPMSFTRSGKSKKILNYNCEEFIARVANTEMIYWVTNELGVNICPSGNVGIIGSVLQFESSYGFNYTATEVTETRYDAKDFEIPADFELIKNNFIPTLPSNRTSWNEKTFPDFDLTDMAGKRITSNDLKGKIVVINFWYSSCKPCIMEMPELNELVDKYKSRTDIVFLGFAIDKKELITAFLQKRKFNYTLIPAATELIKNMSVNTFPLHLVIDNKGKIKAEIIGYNGKEGETKNSISRLIDAL